MTPEQHMQDRVVAKLRGLGTVLERRKAVAPTDAHRAALAASCAALATAMREVTALPLTGGWQPMQTSPKDGSPVDLWVRLADGRGFRVTDARWLRRKWRGVVDGADSEGPVERVYGTSGEGVVVGWMPVPEPMGVAGG